MNTTRLFPAAAAAFFLLAPIVHAEEKDLFHPQFSAIMVGYNHPKDKDSTGGAECLFVEGFMVNPYFGWQLELGGIAVTNSSDANAGTFYDLVFSVKLALPVAFVEPYVLGGAGIGGGYGGIGFPLSAAVGIDVNFGRALAGLEVRQNWLTVEGRNLDALMVMGKGGVRF
jgi:hypothetical protein